MELATPALLSGAYGDIKRLDGSMERTHSAGGRTRQVMRLRLGINGVKHVVFRP